MTAQKFNIAVGFLNLTCTNQCLSTDGYKEEIKATSSRGLYQFTLDLFGQYNVAKHIHLMQSLGDTMLSEKQFCQILGRMRLYNYLLQHQQRMLPRLLITDSQINNVAKHIHLMQSLGDTMLSEKQFCQILGRMRLYNYLPQHQQRMLPRLLITDSQINNVAKQYIHDENFTGTNSELSMWMFYNLITGANKNSYLDSFLGRSVNATEISVGLTEALNHRDEAYSWFIE